MDFTRRAMPSLAELVAFESAGRLKSFTRAAEELNLTQGAVSRQIRNLEETLGAALFERVRRTVVLTDAGALFLADVRKLLEGLGEASARAVGFGAEHVLNLAVLPTFATRWLMPRMPGFLKVRPGVTVNFLVRLEPFSFDQQPFDAAIHFGDGVWPGAETHYLCREEIAAVASPELVRRLGLRGPADLAKATLLHQTTRPDSWREWLAFQRSSHPAPDRGLRLEQFAMIVEAAMAGLGAALIPKFLAAAEIGQGRLSVIPAPAFESSKAYWLAVPERKRSDPMVAAFLVWLQREIAPLAQGPAPAVRGKRRRAAR